jgi:hypothetical protein
VDDDERQRRGLRDGLLAVGFAAVAAVGMYLYLRRAIPSRQELLATDAVAPSAAEGPALRALDEAREAARRFVAAASAGRFDEAVALTAAPYRRGPGERGLRDGWRRARALDGAGTLVVRTVRQETAAASAGAPEATSVSVQGLVTSRVGTMDATFRFVTEDGHPRLLTLFVAGVPVVDGVTAR